MADSPDGNPNYERSSPFPVRRSTFPVDMERVQSGGLEDDPTDSGDPVRNHKPFKNLTPQGG